MSAACARTTPAVELVTIWVAAPAVVASGAGPTPDTPIRRVPEREAHRRAP